MGNYISFSAKTAQARLRAEAKRRERERQRQEEVAIWKERIEEELNKQRANKPAKLPKRRRQKDPIAQAEAVLSDVAQQVLEHARLVHAACEAHRRKIIINGEVVN